MAVTDIAGNSRFGGSTPNGVSSFSAGLSNDVPTASGDISKMSATAKQAVERLLVALQACDPILKGFEGELKQMGVLQLLEGSFGRMLPGAIEKSAQAAGQGAQTGGPAGAAVAGGTSLLSSIFGFFSGEKEKLKAANNLDSRMAAFFQGEKWTDPKTGQLYDYSKTGVVPIVKKWLEEEKARTLSSTNKTQAQKDWLQLDKVARKFLTDSSGLILSSFANPRKSANQQQWFSEKITRISESNDEFTAQLKVPPSMLSATNRKTASANSLNLQPSSGLKTEATTGADPAPASSVTNFAVLKSVDPELRQSYLDQVVGKDEQKEMAKRNGASA